MRINGIEKLTYLNVYTILKSSSRCIPTLAFFKQFSFLRSWKVSKAPKTRFILIWWACVRLFKINYLNSKFCACFLYHGVTLAGFLSQFYFIMDETSISNEYFTFQRKIFCRGKDILTIFSLLAIYTWILVSAFFYEMSTIFLGRMFLFIHFDEHIQFIIFLGSRSKVLTGIWLGRFDYSYNSLARTLVKIILKIKNYLASFWRFLQISFIEAKMRLAGVPQMV